MWTLQILITTWKLITLDKLLSWAGVLGAQQLYLPAPHGKRQGSICHDDKWRIDPSSRMMAVGRTWTKVLFFNIHVVPTGRG